MAYNGLYMSGDVYYGGLGAPKMYMLDTVDGTGVALAGALAAGYVTDGVARGLSLGDVVFVRTWSALPITGSSTLTSVTACQVSAINATTGAATLAAQGSAASFTSLSKFNATADPAATNDNTQGYVIGSEWLNTNTGILWVATSVGTGTATWTPTTSDIVIPFTGLAMSSSAPGIFTFVAPWKFKIVGFKAVFLAPSGNPAAATTCTLAIAGTAVTSAQASFATGDAVNAVKTANPTALNTGASGALITATVATATTTTNGTINGTIELVQTN